MGERRANDDARDDDGADRRGEARSTVASGVDVGASTADAGPGDAGHGAGAPPASGSRSTDTGGGSVRRGPVGGLLDRLTAVEPWAPEAPSGRETRSVRRRLHPEESLQTVDTARLLGDVRGPAAVGVTDDRLLAVTDGGFVSAGLDGLAAVHSATESTLDLRGRDARLLGAVGYLCSVLAFLGVLAVAANPLTPALALGTVGGVLAADHVRRDGVVLNGRTLTDRLGEYRPLAALASGIRRAERPLPWPPREDPLARWGAGALAVVPFAALLALESSLLAPPLALGVVGSFALVVYAVRHGEEFEGVELLRRDRRTVSATFEDGTVVTFRTHPESRLPRELAAHVGRGPVRSPGGES